MSRCWAYNVEGNRCEQDAGHSGDHEIKKTWNDDECFSPIQFQVPAKQERTTPPAPQPKVDTATRCVACNHHHKSGECKCGCHEHIG